MQGDLGTGSARSREGCRASGFPANGRQGFTLLELVVAVSILLALALVALPMTGGLDRARRTRVLADCAAVGTALRRYMEDTRFRPTGAEGAATVDVLGGDLGSDPSSAHFSGMSMQLLASVTRTNTWGSPRWRGPYLEPLQADPWGRRYLVWVRNFHTGKPVWVLSAGADGIVQTGPDDETLMGDDVGGVVE